jgi:hypothetical protein
MQCQGQLDNQKEGVPELVEMQKGFVGVVQGAQERIAGAPAIDK